MRINREGMDESQTGNVDALAFSVDLELAANRSEFIPADWSKSCVAQAVERYRRFFFLSGKYPDVCLAPAKDIDLVWHLHMQSPVAYHEDCIRHLGQILDHDGGFGSDPDELPELQKTFEETAQIWREEFGEDYVVADDDPARCTRNCVSRCKRACKTKH